MTTEYLLQREVDNILSILTTGNALVMRVALHTGLRVGDVLNLKTEQLCHRFWITESKTGKRRQIGLPQPLLNDLKNSAGEFWVFPGKNPKKHRTRQAVWKDVKRAAHAFRIPQNVAPHSARKIFAVDLLKKYGNIEKVSRALNHSSLSVTLIYALADQQLESKNIRRRSAPGRKKV